MTEKRIMVLGAGRGQVGLIKKIKNSGHKCIVASISGDYPGFEIADEICYVDIADREAVLNAVKQYNADAVVTCCLDTGIGALGYACEKSNLIGLSSKSAEISNNKLLMKKAFAEHGVSTAKYKMVSDITEIEDVIDNLSFPMIVKAVDLQGSRGIYISHNPYELYSGFAKAMVETKKDFCIIEEYIVGQEFGAQAFVADGEVLFVTPAGDITYLSETNIPIGHYYPLDFDQKMLDKICEQVKSAIKAVGFNNSAVNVDLILKDGTIYVIELTGRVGANCLPELTSIYLGVDIYEMIYKIAIGENVKDYYLQHKSENLTPCYAKMLISQKSGVLKKIINKNKEEKDLFELTFFVKPGDKISKFTNSRDCLGQIIVQGSSLSECKETVTRIEKNIIFEVE